VVPSEKRRRLTAAYKLRVLAEADACVQRGELGGLLRREGVYHSDIANWRKQKANGTLGSAPASRAARSTSEYQEAARQLSVVSGENRKLRRELARAQQIIDIQKKAARLLGETLQEMSLDDIDDES
jgi:transposase